ncbi:hypothetical protein DID99_01170 [Burkholderia sp. Bp8986]|nr:hypothetical protein DID99_01170 [Burkholderia sp. Bp8986]
MGGGGAAGGGRGRRHAGDGDPVALLGTGCGSRAAPLKCIDLYHGKELDAAAKQLVLRPNSTYRTEHSPKSQ